MIICSIDPGASGFFCQWNVEKKTVSAEKIPWFAGGLEDFVNRKCELVVIEKLGQLPPKMARKTIMSMGINYGMVLHSIRIFPKQFVLPKAWQKVCLEGTNKRNDTKLRSIEAFVKMNPKYASYKIDHNMSDAYHIGRYWLMQLGLFGTYKWALNEGISLQSTK